MGYIGMPTGTAEDLASPGPIGGTSPAAGAFTTLSATGQFTSTVTTGTAPFVVASTTVVANLNASSLGGATFAAPGTIGGGTPGVATFTTLTASGISITFAGVGAGAAAGKKVLCIDDATGLLHKSSSDTACAN